MTSSESHSRIPNDALDNARVICGLLTGAVDGLPIPGLKAVAQTCTSILDIALTLKANKEDALIVAERACELAKAIVDGTRATECNLDASKVEDNLTMEKFVLVLKDVENVMVTLSRQKFFQRLRKFRGNQQEIADCKEKIDHAFKALLVTVSLGLRRAIVMSQSSASNVADEDVDSPDVPVIPIEKINLSEYKEGTKSIQEGELEPETKRVIVKLYRDQKIWCRDLTALKRQRNPYLLQLIGRSSKKSNPLYTVLRDPGVPMQRYVMQQCIGTPRDASLNLITSIKGMVGGAQYLCMEKGGRLFDTAAVYIRPSGNAVLAEFDHGDSHSEIAPTTDHTWDAFIRLSAKVITGSEGKPNYVLGEHGTTGQRATRLMRFYLHFIFDYRFSHSKIQPGGSDDNSASTLFDNLFLTLSKVQDDIEGSRLDSDNPMLESLQKRFSSGLCGIWDVWESLEVTPGDIGVMDKGRDSKRPQFNKFTNVAQEISDVYAVKRDVYYWPETLWSRDTLPDGMIRHTLRLKDANVSTTSFGFLEGEDLANLNSEWDKAAAWKWLEENRPILEALAETHSVDIHDICLIFSYSKSPKLTRIKMKQPDMLSQRNTVLVDAGFPDGILYYFENPSAEEGEVHGYWSGSPEPGKLVWPPALDAPGPVWGWCHGDDHFEQVMVSRKDPVEHIRYLGY